jgi:hypothetical protein
MKHGAPGMSIHDQGINHPMTSMTFDDVARKWVAELEKAEASRTGLKRDKVRKSLAGKIGIAPGTIENIRRRRIKDFRRGGIGELIRSYMVHHLQLEIQRKTNDLQMVLECGKNPSADEVARLRGAIAKAQTLVEEVEENG